MLRWWYQLPDQHRVLNDIADHAEGDFFVKAFSIPYYQEDNWMYLHQQQFPSVQLMPGTNQIYVRLRLSLNELFIDDIRAYDESFAGPYLFDKANAIGWWIVPFLLDLSRDFAAADNLALAHDSLASSPDLDRITIQHFTTDQPKIGVRRSDAAVTIIDHESEETIISFDENGIVAPETTLDYMQDALVSRQHIFPVNGQKPSWEAIIEDESMRFVVAKTDLEVIRDSYKIIFSLN